MIENKYEIIKLVGKGSYGKVSKAKCKQTGKFVALKVLKYKHKSDYDLIKVLREIKLLNKFT